MQIKTYFQSINLQIKEVLGECDLTNDPNVCHNYVEMQENNTQGPNDESFVEMNNLMQMDSHKCACANIIDQTCMDLHELVGTSTFN